MKVMRDDVAASGITLPCKIRSSIITIPSFTGEGEERLILMSGMTNERKITLSSITLLKRWNVSLLKNNLNNR